MKHLVAALFLTTFASGSLLAHEHDGSEATSSRWLKVSADVPFALFGAFIAKGELRVGDHMSLMANIGYIDTRISINPDINSHKIGNDGFNIIKFGIGGRWYLKGGCMEGFYAENMLDSDIWLTYSGNAISLAPSVNLGPVAWTIQDTFHIGYSWVSNIGFFVDGAMGINVEAPIAGFPTNAIKFNFYPTTPDVRVMNRFEARLNVGWAF